ncbi:UDP-N-acetylmuramoyl-tripeptide--D-alanyl-D-alanine ligase, partial [bacterium]|nr:UDP-N-acetylmuramoyl-tripeptide--D-alanyl-D-alanine ligase [bacterium]
AKGELFKVMRKDGVVIVNNEDKWILKLAGDYAGKKITFGMKNNSDVRFGYMESQGLDGVSLIVYIRDEERKLNLPVPGSHNVMNALAAAAAACALGIDTDDIISGLQTFKPLSMRMERMQLANGVQLVSDCYNANPTSMKEAFRTVSGFKRAGRFVAMLGDMFELGDSAEELHRQVGRDVSAFGVDKLFVIGDCAKKIAEGAYEKGMNGSSIFVASNVDEAQEKLFDELKSGDILLVKGSRGMKMERIVEYLKYKIGI